MSCKTKVKHAAGIVGGIAFFFALIPAIVGFAAINGLICNHD